MILRLVAAGALALGLSTSSLYLMEMGKAPGSSAAERHLRAMKDRVGEPAACTPTTFEEMTALPRRAALAEYAEIERRGVSLEGYVLGFARAADGDYHLEFAPRLDPEGKLVPFLSAEIAPQHQRGSRTWTCERLGERFRSRYGGRTGWEQPPRRVRLSGWLMYDAPYEGARPSPGFPPHLTSWEIHPVTRVEVWNHSLGRYEEFAR